MRLGAERRAGDQGAAVVTSDRLRTLHFHAQGERIGGVRDALTAVDLDPEGLTIVESYEHLPASGAAAAELALQTNPRITALMCTADVLAISAMDYLRAHGIYVPGQMTVTGFDGIPDALSRGLTTVSQPSLEKGKRAGRLLHSPPRDGLPVIDVLPTELVRGRTAGPPA
jgi:DNA-binding LacI/PurR family transcriptional regulator